MLSRMNLPRPLRAASVVALAVVLTAGASGCRTLRNREHNVRYLTRADYRLEVEQAERLERFLADYALVEMETVRTDGTLTVTTDEKSQQTLLQFIRLVVPKGRDATVEVDEAPAEPAPEAETDSEPPPKADPPPRSKDL